MARVCGAFFSFGDAMRDDALAVRSHHYHDYDHTTRCIRDADAAAADAFHSSDADIAIVVAAE